MNHLPQAPEYNIRIISNFLKVRKIFASQGAPPVSTTLMANFATSTAGVVDNGVNDASGKLPLVSTTPAANLPPVSTTPEVLVAKFSAGVVNNGNYISLLKP
jgi:hypothetical protein